MKIPKIVSLGALILVSALSLFSNEKIFFVNVDKLNIRNTPSINAQVIGMYKISEKDRVLNIQKDWIESPKGFVNRNYVTTFELVREVKTTGIVNVKSLTVRAGPGREGAVLSEYTFQEEIDVFGVYKNQKNELWGYSGIGYVLMEYISLQDSKSKKSLVRKNREKEEIQKKENKSNEKELKVVKTPKESMDKSSSKEYSYGFSLDNVAVIVDRIKASPKGTGIVDVNKIHSNALSLTIETQFEKELSTTLHPLLRLSIIDFIDRKLYLASIGFEKRLKTLQGLAPYLSFTLGNGSLSWEKDPLKSIRKMDKSSNSIVASLKVGSIYKVNSSIFDFSLRYDKGSFNTNITTDAGKGSIKDNDFIFISLGTRF